MPVSALEEYIQVIVPLKLDWNPTYRIPAELRGRVRVGDRVKVRIGARLTDAVVSQVDVTPDIAPERIHAIEGLEEGLERITPEEIQLWEFIAEYYLCTVGEVFKCAYPVGKIRSEETAARVRERAEASRRKIQEAARLRIAKLEAEIEAVRQRTDEALSQLTPRGIKTKEKLIATRDARLERLREALASARALLDDAEAGTGLPISEGRGLPRPGNALRNGQPRPDSDSNSGTDAVQSALQSGKPVLLQGSAAERRDCYLDLITETLSQGRTAFLLLPEIALTEAFENDMQARFGTCALVFHSRETTVQRRKIADALRAPGPHLLIGTRSALFLPFQDLGLIIVDEEQDRSYKQDSPAPRYNARDCAVVLAGIHDAGIVLGSGTPSLESRYNCAARRYVGVGLPSAPVSGSERLKIIDTVAERRKRGMKGQFSIKLMDEIRYALDQDNPVYLIRLWGDIAPSIQEAQNLFPGVRVCAMRDEGLPEEEAPIRVGTLAQTKRLRFGQGSLVALLQADPILGTQDFRADERAFQLFSRYLEHCAAGTFIIQTGRS